MKAIWNGQVIAESKKTIAFDGNYYFPPDTIYTEYFNTSDYHSLCPWKGKASYYTITVSGQSNINAAWFYPSPKADAKNIKNYIAFWKGIEITE